MIEVVTHTLTLADVLNGDYRTKLVTDLNLTDPFVRFSHLTLQDSASYLRMLEG